MKKIEDLLQNFEYKESDDELDELKDEFDGQLHDDDAEDIPSEDDIELSSSDEETTQDGIPKSDMKGFASAFNTIISRQVGSGSHRTPILAERKEDLEKIQIERQDAKLRKKLAMEKKELKNMIRIPVDITKKPYEKQLKSLATRGVVQLFNAVMHHRRKVMASEANKKTIKTISKTYKEDSNKYKDSKNKNYNKYKDSNKGKVKSQEKKSFKKEPKH